MEQNKLQYLTRELFYLAIQAAAISLVVQELKLSNSKKDRDYVIKLSKIITKSVIKIV